METTKATQRWLGQTADNRNFAYALLAGLALEIAALIVVLPLVKQPIKPAQTPGPVRLTIAAPPTPKPPAPPVPMPPPLPLPPVAKPSPPLPKPPPLTRTPPAPRPVPHPMRHLPPPPPRQIPVQPPMPPMPPVSPAPAAPPPAPPSAGQVDLFRDALRRAVQEVANSVHPQDAQEGGTAEITISYLNGHALDVTLVRSSGFPVLDAAALQAGRIAPYPAPPPAFANHIFACTIAVIFQAAAPSVDSD